MSAKLSLQVEASIDALRQIQNAVEEFGQAQNLPPSLTYQINLALEELGINIVNYAYDDDKTHEFEISLVLEVNTLTIEIIDDGRAFNPLSEAPEPDLYSNVEDRPIGGLGVHLVRSIMDELHYRREAERNHITLVKRVAK